MTYPLVPTIPNFASWIQLCGRRRARTVRAASSDTGSPRLSDARWSIGNHRSTISGGEVVGNEPLDARDRARRRTEADGQHRHLRVGRIERAVAAAAEMTAPGEVDELPAGCGRDEHLACVRVAERGSRPRVPIGDFVEQRRILIAVPPRDDAPIL